MIVRASDCVDPYGTARQWLPVDDEGWVTAYSTSIEANVHRLLGDANKAELILYSVDHGWIVPERGDIWVERDGGNGAKWLVLAVNPRGTSVLYEELRNDSTLSGCSGETSTERFVSTRTFLERPPRP